MSNKVAGKKDTKPALTPKLRFPVFRDAPAWRLREIGDFLTESRLTGNKGNVAKKITVKLWGNGVFEKNEAVQGSVNTQYFRRKAGQFIYSKLDFLNQAFGVIPASLDNFESTVDLPCFDVKDGLNSVFLLEYVKRKDFYERVGEAADGSRKARRIHAETFLGFSAAIPSLPEQQKIAECLTTLDEVIAAQSQKLDALKTHKKGLMQQLFPREGETLPRLRFPEFQAAPEWEEDTLDNIASFRRGSFPQPYGLPEWYDAENGTPFIQVFDVGPDFRLKQETKSKISKLGAEKSVFIPKGTLIVTLQGSIGRVAITHYDAYIDRTLLIFESFQKPIEITFFARVIQNLFDIEKEKAPGGIIKTITKEVLSDFKVKLPTIPEQQRIATCLTSLDDLITAQSAKLSALKTHKRGLMQQLFPSPEEVEA